MRRRQASSAQQRGQTMQAGQTAQHTLQRKKRKKTTEQTGANLFKQIECFDHAVGLVVLVQQLVVLADGRHEQHRGHALKAAISKFESKNHCAKTTRKTQGQTSESTSCARCVGLRRRTS